MPTGKFSGSAEEGAAETSITESLSSRKPSTTWTPLFDVMRKRFARTVTGSGLAWGTLVNALGALIVTSARSKVPPIAPACSPEASASSGMSMSRLRIVPLRISIAVPAPSLSPGPKVAPTASTARSSTTAS